jgi:hypothetical protein
MIEDGRAGPAMIAAGAAQQRDEADDRRRSPPLPNGLKEPPVNEPGSPE